MRAAPAPARDGAVNETIIAITRTPPVPTRPVRAAPRPRHSRPPTRWPSRPRPCNCGQGSGTVASWSTEGGPQSAQHGSQPLHRADGCRPARAGGGCTGAAGGGRQLHRVRHVLAGISTATFASPPESQGPPRPRHSAVANPVPPSGREGHPPVAVVFNPGTRLGGAALKNRMNRVMDLTRNIWSGSYHRMGGYSQDEDGYYNYADSVPILFTTLERLHTYGPLDAAWWRCGHGQWQTLEAALTNPNDNDAWHQRDDELRRRREEQWEKERREALSLAWGHRPAESMDVSSATTTGPIRMLRSVVHWPRRLVRTRSVERLPA